MRLETWKQVYLIDDTILHVSICVRPEEIGSYLCCSASAGIEYFRYTIFSVNNHTDIPKAEISVARSHTLQFVHIHECR